MKTTFEWIERQSALLCGLCTAFIGLATALVWPLHTPWLAALWSRYAPMQINTAIGLTIAGAGLILIGRRERAAAICGALAGSLGAVTLLEYALKIDPGFDTVFFPHAWPLGVPTRMAANTAVCFLLAGAGLMCESAGRRVSGMWALFAGYATVIVAGSALTGYGLNVEIAYRWAAGTRMSIFTAAAFLPLGAGLFKTGWERVNVNRTLWLTLLTAGLVVGTSLLTWIAVDAAYRRMGQPPVVPNLMLFTALTRCGIAAIFVFLVRTNMTRLSQARSLNTSLLDEVTERTAQLRAIFDAVKVGTWTHDLSTNRTVFEGHGNELFGFPANSAEHSFEDIIRATHPEDRQALREAPSQAAERLEAIDAEFRVLWPDGSVHWILAKGGVSKQENGKPLLLSGINLDVTRIKNTERALQSSEAAVRKLNEALERRIRIQTKELVESERRFRLMVEGLRDYAFFMLDTDGRVVSWNQGAERINGYPAEAILGKHFSILCTPEDVQRGHPEEELQAAAEQGHFEETGWRLRKDGSRFWAHVLVTPVYNESGDLCGFSKLVRDITERKNSREEIEAQRRRAEDANQAKSRFLASMSHEIRTPMNAILGMTDLLWDTDLDEEQRHYVEIFRRAGTNLMDLINDILDLSKIEAGRLKLEKAEFSVEQVISDVVELLTPRAQDKGIGLRARLQPALPSRVIGDAGRLRQVLVNLVGNAVKFTSSGEIVLAVERPVPGEPGEIRFLVSDTGIGIPANKLATIFEPFEQADAATARKFGGTGLGLSICQRLISCMEGTLEVESELGRGSTFHFNAKFGVAQTQPRASEPAPVMAGNQTVHAPAAIASQAAPNMKRILLAEDSPDNRFLIEAYLKGTSYALTPAVNGRTALEKFQEQPFDVVLMDMQMPIMDGLSATRAIRAFEASRGRKPVPIVALTANAHNDAIENCRQAGCTAHVAKPVSKSSLLRALTEALGETAATVPAPARGERREPMPAPRIEVPPGLEALAPRYISARRKELPEMVALLAAADYEQIGSRGHNMKGTGRSYGFPDLTDIGAALERSAKHRDKDAVDKQLMRLANYLESMRIAGEPAEETSR